MKIYACPRCGSREIFMGTIDSGVLIGVSSTKSVCRNCGFQGNPLLFTSKKQYQQFIEEIKKQDIKEKNGKEKESTKKEGLTEKDRLVLDYVKDIKIHKITDEEQRDTEKNKNWWPEIFIALIISIGTSVVIYPSLVTVMTEPYMTIYLMGYIFISFMIALIIILIIEYILKTLNNKIFHLQKKP